MKVLYIAPYQDYSGYAVAGRNLIRALATQPDVELACRPLKYDNGMFDYGDDIAQYECNDLNNIDIVIQHTTPDETTYMPGVKNVNWFAWETDRFSQEWVKALEKFDLILAPCDDNISAYQRSGGEVQIKKLMYAFEDGYYEQNRAPLNIPQAGDKMRFYTICQLSKKKGIEPMLRGFYRAFDGHDDVILIMKLYQNGGPDDVETVHNYINAIKQMTRHHKHPPVLPLVEIMDDEIIARLHKSCDVYLATSRAEGLNVPAFDALSFGNPVIATNWGGMKEFVTSENGWLVDYVMSPCFAMNHPVPYMYTSNESWAEPDVMSIVNSMQESYHMWKHGTLKNKTDNVRNQFQQYTYENVGKQLADYLGELL